jgi:D-3-phosphoglycerate dehydrogenase / 2-oxoglutarate reductase
MMRVLICDEMHASITALLEKEGFEVTYSPAISRAQLLKEVANYEGIIIRSKTPLDRPLLEKATRLKFVARAGAGLDLLDVDYLHEKKVKLFHAAKGNRDAVAEHALGGILALFNRLAVADQEVRRGVWNREANRGIELKGKTVGIIGYGNMGKAFAKRLEGFGVKVMAYDKYLSGFGNKQVQESTWKKIKAKADVLSIHVPLTPETRDFLTLDELKEFAKPIWLINTARGELIRMSTLNQALDQGILRGAVLDVLENEKFDRFNSEQQKEFESLSRRENVLFTPHVAGWTMESYQKINEVLVKQIKKSFKKMLSSSNS